MLYQFIEVASCEISAADATLEQNVTREHAVVFFAIVHQTAGWMSGYVYCFQFGMSESDDISVVQVFAAVYLFFPTKQSFIRDMELPRLSEWRKLKTHFLDNKK